MINPFIALQLLALDLSDRVKREEKGASAVENALLALCGEPPWPPSRRH